MTAGYDGQCVFCGIVAGTVEASVVHDGPATTAFLDIAPATPGHLLVVPRTHAPSLAALDPEVGAEMFRVAQRMAAALRASDQRASGLSASDQRASGLRCEGVNLWLADGVPAGQEVFHVHLHVLPRYPGDGVVIAADFDHPARDVLDRQAATLRAALDG